MGRSDVFGDGRYRHGEESLRHSQTVGPEVDLSPRPAAEDKDLTAPRATKVQCIQYAGDRRSCEVQAHHAKWQSACPAVRMTSSEERSACLQLGHQQLSSGTAPPILVLARAGVMSPLAVATPAPRAGAAGTKSPAGFIPSVRCSS